MAVRGEVESAEHAGSDRGEDAGSARGEGTTGVTVDREYPDREYPDRERTDVRGSQTVAAVERAADILLHFTRTRTSSLGVTDIASEMGLPKAAVHRVLASLRSRDLIAFDERTRRYSLGPTALLLGLTCLDRLDVRTLAAAELPALSAATGETATLSLMAGGNQVYVDQTTPRREIIMSVVIGVPHPLYANGSARVFLAYQDESTIENQLTGLAGLTVTAGTGASSSTEAVPDLDDQALADVERMRDELRKIRRQGWARTGVDGRPGAASVAAPVFDHSGVPAAVLSLCGPADRFAPAAERCRDELLGVARQLSRKMGYLAD